MIVMYWGRVCAKLDLWELVAVLVAQITMGSIALVCISPSSIVFLIFPFLADCLASTTCSGHGTCEDTAGKCVCDLGYAGADCSTCAINYYGPGCSTCK